MHSQFHFTRIISAFLSILLCIVYLVSCGGDQSEFRHSANENDASSYPIDAGVISEYTIVRGDNSGNPVLKQALNLRSLIRTQCGCNLPLTTDFTEDKGLPEILIGSTNRQESSMAAKELSDSVQYVIKSYGNKIAIVANTQNKLAEAVAYFVENYIAEGKTELSKIRYAYTSNDLVLYSADTRCSFVIPDNTSDEFIICAQSMLDSLAISEFSLIRYSEYTGGNAVMLGNIPDDEISNLYANLINENEYIARSAAGHVYLQGYNEFLTLTAFGDFLVDIQKNADKDFAGNRYLFSTAGYAFNNTWEFSAPKPFQAVLDNSENITGSSHIFYYSEVSEHSFSLFKQMLGFFGYTLKPYTTNVYVMGDNVLTLSYLSSDHTLSVLLGHSTS